jgi:hypothetical protein
MARTIERPHWYGRKPRRNAPWLKDSHVKLAAMQGMIVDPDRPGVLAKGNRADTVRGGAAGAWGRVLATLFCYGLLAVGITWPMWRNW